MRTISDRVRWARGVVPGLSQRKLSWVSGLSPAAIRLIETNPRCNPEASTLMGIARALGLPLAWLLTGEGAPPSERAIKRAAAVAERPADAPTPKPRKRAA